jgi:3-phosphoinositide dependent protein kinase-1
MEMVIPCAVRSTPVVILSALVSKRAGESWKTRQLIMTTKPRIMYFDENLSVLKGEIEYAPELRIEVDGSVFRLVTPHKTYEFSELSSEDPSRWVTALEQLHKLNN